MNKYVEIALIQFTSVLGDIEANVRKGIQMVESAVDKGARIICFPEAFASGYDFAFFKEKMVNLAEDLNGYTISELRKTAKRKNAYIITPIILRTNRKNAVTISSVVINDNGEIMGIYSKNHLWHIGEEDFFEKGSGYPIFRTKYCDIGIIICYDLNFPEPTRILTLKGAKLIFMCSTWIQKDKYIYDILIPARALENKIFFAAANMFDKKRNMVGNSKIANPNGEIIAESLKKSEDILVCKIDLEEITEARSNAPYLTQRRPEQYFPICI